LERSSDAEERRPSPREDSRRIDGTAALAAIEQFYEQEQQRERGTEPFDSPSFTVDVESPEVLDSPPSTAELGRALPRRRAQVIVGTAVLVAIALLGYYNYRQHFLGDATQLFLAKSEQRGRDGPADTGAIRRDMAALKTIPAQNAPRAATAEKAEPSPTKTAAATASPGQETPKPAAAPSLEPASLTAPAIVLFAIAPWGEIYVDGQKRGVNPPMREIELSPGQYKIEVRNTTFPAYVRTIEVEAGSQIKIMHHFP